MVSNSLMKSIIRVRPGVIGYTRGYDADGQGPESKMNDITFLVTFEMLYLEKIGAKVLSKDGSVFTIEVSPDVRERIERSPCYRIVEPHGAKT